MCAAADHPSRTRDGLLDTARALAILGIVYSHVVAGLRRADLIDHDTWWVAVNAILYQWRLPILALVVGLFIPHAVERDGASGYLRRRVSSFLWLYVVWFVILGLVTAALGDAANDDRGWTALVTPWRVDNHLWFLPHLVVSTTIVVLLRPWDSHRRRVWSLLISAALGLATWVVNPAWIGLRGMALVPFAVLGASWGWRTVASWVALRWRVLLAVLAGALAVRIAAYDAIVPPTLTNDAGIPGVWWRVPLSFMVSLAGAVGVLAVAHVLRLKGRWRGLWARLGQLTLPVYVSHTLFTAGVRIGLVSLDVTHPWVHLGLGLAAGVVGPLVLHRLARGPASWLFSAPWERPRVDLRQRRPGTGLT